MQTGPAKPAAVRPESQAWSAKHILVQTPNMCGQHGSRGLCAARTAVQHGARQQQNVDEDAARERALQLAVQLCWLHRRFSYIAIYAAWLQPIVRHACSHKTPRETSSEDIAPCFEDAVAPFGDAGGGCCPEHYVSQKTPHACSVMPPTMRALRNLISQKESIPRPHHCVVFIFRVSSVQLLIK